MLFLSKLKNQEVNSPLIFIHFIYSIPRHSYPQTDRLHIFSHRERK